MRAHTQEFKEQIKELGKQINSRITYGDTIITAEELYSINPVANTSLLKSIMKELDFESSVSIPLYSNIKYEFGLLVNGNYEYIDYGNYIVHSCEYNEDTKSYNYVCYDAMLFSMKTYTELKSLTILQKEFPMTIRDYIMCLCTDIGLTFKNRTETFANYDQILDSDLYANLNYTYRDIFDELSQVTASNICINGNNQVEIRYLNDTGDTIDEEYLKDINVKFGEKYGPINSIVLSRSAESDNVYLQDESSIKSNGLCEIKIVDNQIMNFNNRSDYLPDILEKLNGLEYYLNDYSSTGILYYELCDKYNIKIGENTYNCILFNDEPKITQGLVENIYTEMPEESVTDYTKADKTDRKINQAYILVDKQNQKINALVENVDNIDLTLTTRKQASGFNNINIQDAGNYNVAEFGIDGNSYQETTKGNQLVDFNNMTMNNSTYTFENDILTISSNETGNYNNVFYNITNVVKNNPGKSLKFVFENLDISNFNSRSSTISQLRVVNNGTTSYYGLCGKTGTTTQYNIPEDTSGITNVLFYVYANNYSSYVDSTVVITKPMLQIGTDELEYEEYTGGVASPNPDYPQEIKAVESNLFDKNKCVQGNYNALATMKSIRLTQFICPISIGQKYTFNVLNSNLRIAIGIGSAGEQISGNQMLFDSGWVTSTYTITATKTGYLFLTISKKDNTEITLDDISQNDFEISIGEEIGNIGIQNVGKNLFNVVDYSDIRFTSNSNPTILSNENKTISFIGNGNYSGIYIGINTLKAYTAGYKKGTEYIISADIEVDNDTSIQMGADYRVLFDVKKGIQRISIKTTIDTTALIFYNRTEDTITYSVSNIMISPSEDINYKSYEEQLTYINLQDNFIGKIGNIKDKLYIKDGRAYLEKHINKVILTGSEGWSYNSQYSRYEARLSSYPGSNAYNVISDYFVYNGVNQNGIWVNNAGDNLQIRIKDSRFADVNDLKTWLQSNNVTLYYILATPETIDLGEVLFKTFEGVNNILLLASMETDIDTIYLTDSPLNGEYTSRAEFIIETDKITSEVNKKVSVDNFETIVQELDSKIEQTSDSITSSVSATYSTKDETTKAKNDAISSANTSTDSKLEKYSTTTEMNSAIQQTADSINSVVSTKIGEDEVVSSINQSAEQITLKSNRLVVESDNFKLDKTGNITATGGTMGGYTLSDNNLSVLIKPDYDYTSADLQTILDYYLGKITLTDEEKTRLDYNKDGVVDLFDATAIQNMLDNGITRNTPGQFLINANDAYFNLAILDGNGETKTEIGLAGIKTNKLSSPEINKLNGITNYSEEEQVIGTFMNKPLYRKTGQIKFTSVYTGSGSHIRGSFISSDIEYGTISQVFNSSSISNSLYNGYNSAITSNIYVENAVGNSNKGYIMGFTNKEIYLNEPIYVVVDYTKTTD